MPIEAVIIDHAELPAYLKIAEKAKQRRGLGLSDRASARAFGVSDKTVAKAAGEAEALASGGRTRRAARDRASSFRPPSTEAPAGCGPGCPHQAGA
jgi:hypothetical protein